MRPIIWTVDKKNKLLSLFKNVDKLSARMEKFAQFCLSNKKAINKFLQLRAKTQTDRLSEIMIYVPNLLDFENKRAFFKKELTRIKRNQSHRGCHLNLKRSNIFMDTYSQMSFKQPREWMGALRVDFHREGGIDAGGVTRDFFIELSREMFNPMYSLFQLTSNGVSYYPYDQSHS